ncbi:9336_t:CDS:2, partial [Paraglomus occultum]
SWGSFEGASMLRSYTNRLPSFACESQVQRRRFARHLEGDYKQSYVSEMESESEQRQINEAERMANIFAAPKSNSS